MAEKKLEPGEVPEGKLRVDLPGLFPIYVPRDFTPLEIKEQVDRFMFGKKDYRVTPTGRENTTPGLSGLPLNQRIRQSFVTGEDVPGKELQSLKSIYGEGNVRKTDRGEVQFRPTAQEEFRPIDPSKFEPVGDLADIAGEAPEVIGGTAGEILGSATAGVPGTIAGGFLGGSIGRGVKQGVGSLMGVPGPDTSKEAGLGILEGGLIGGAGAGIGEGVGSLLKRLVGGSAARGTIKPGFSEADRFLKEEFPIQPVNPALGRLGSALRHPIESPRRLPVRLSPAEATRSRLLDISSNILDRAIFGGGRFQAFKLNRQLRIQRSVKDIAESFGQLLGKEEVGQAMLDTMDKRFNILEAPAKALREGIEREAAKRVDPITGLPLITVDMSDLQKFVKVRKEVLERIKLNSTPEEATQIDSLLSIGKQPSSPKLQAGFSPGSPPTKSPQLPKSTLSFLDALKLKKELGNSMSNAKFDDRAFSARISEALGILDETIKDSLESQAPDLFKDFVESNKIFKENFEVFQSDFMKALFKRAKGDVIGITPKEVEGEVAEILIPKGTPEVVVNTLMVKGEVSTVKKIKRAVGPDSVAWANMKAWFAEELVKGGTNNGTLSGQQLLKTIDRFGTEMTDEYLGRAVREKIQKFGEVLVLTQEQQAAGAGSMMFALMQPNALVGLGVGAGLGSPAVSGGAAAFLSIPFALSSMFTREKGIDLVLQGMRVGAKTKAATSLLTRMAALNQEIESEVAKDITSSEENPKARTLGALREILQNNKSDKVTFRP